MISYSLEYTDDLANSILAPELEHQLKQEEFTLHKGLLVRLWLRLVKITGFKVDVLATAPFLYLSIPGIVKAHLFSSRMDDDKFNDDDDYYTSSKGLWCSCTSLYTDDYDIAEDILGLYD